MTPKQASASATNSSQQEREFFFKNKFILISQVELHVPSVPVVPAAIEMKVMDPAVPCEYKSDMMNLMPQLSK